MQSWKIFAVNLWELIAKIQCLEDKTFYCPSEFFPVFARVHFFAWMCRPVFTMLYSMISFTKVTKPLIFPQLLDRLTQNSLSRIMLLWAPLIPWRVIYLPRSLLVHLTNHDIQYWANFFFTSSKYWYFLLASSGLWAACMPDLEYSR